MESTIIIYVALVAIAILLVSLISHMRTVAGAAETAKTLLAANTRLANDKLDHIHVLVNSRLSDALQTIEDLKALLLLALSSVISPDDQRIKDALAKKS